MLRRALDESFSEDVRNRITLLTGAGMAVNSCHRFAPPFLAVIARGNGTTLAGIGVAVAISEFSGLLSPLNAEVVERLHRRTAMVLGLIGVALGVMLTASSVHPAMFAGGLIVMSQSKLMFDLGQRSWASDRVPYAQRGRVLGLIEVSWALGLLIGVSLMGLLTAATSWRFGYGLGAAAVVAMAGWIALSVEQDSGPHTPATRSARSPIKVADVAVLVIGLFCLMAASQSLFVTFGSWLEDSFGFTPSAISVVVVGLGFAELAASLTSARFVDSWGKERSSAAGAVLMAAVSIGLAIWHDHVWIGVPLFIIAIAVFEFAIVSSVPLATTAVTGSPARGIALMVVAGTLGRGAASIPATRLYESFGMVWPALLAAGLGTVTVFTMLALHRAGPNKSTVTVDSV